MALIKNRLPNYPCKVSGNWSPKGARVYRFLLPRRNINKCNFTGTGVTYSSDASVAFKDADIIICIGSAREYAFDEEEYNDPFFKEHGESIEGYAKRDAKVIVVGNTAATIVAKYAKSIPIENITAPAMFNLKMAAAQIMTSIANRPSYLRSIAYGVAYHCKVLWNGTPENEWTCMVVSSDHSYDVRTGIFFSFPVICRNTRYEIVQGLCDDDYVANYILYLSRLIARDNSAAMRVLNRDK